MSGYALVITKIKFIKTQEVQQENRDSILISSKLTYRADELSFVQFVARYEVLNINRIVLDLYRIKYTRMK